MIKKPKYIVSSDSIGALGTISDFLFLWKDYFDSNIFDGVEVIANLPMFRLTQLITDLEHNHIPVFSLHGKTGYESIDSLIVKVYIALLNLILIPTKQLLTRFSKFNILVHAPYVKKKFNLIVNNPPQQLIVENHMNHDYSISEVIKIVTLLRQQHINATGLIDIYHYVNYLSTNEILNSWGEIVNKISEYLKMTDDQGIKIFSIIHLPIGPRLGDNLPIDQMTDQMLTEFAEKVIPLVEVVTFENQQKNIGLLLSTQSMLNRQKERNKRVFDRLIKTNVLKI